MICPSKLKAFTVNAIATTAGFSSSSGCSNSVEMRKPPTLYQVLRISTSASQAQIKAAYRNLAKLYHPDAAAAAQTNHAHAQDFIQIHNAYTTLSDPAARAHYDLSIASPRQLMYSTSTTSRWETDQCW